MIESADVQSHPDRKDAALLTFKERYVAEKFINQAKDIPHIGPVELSWVVNSNVSASTPSSSTAFSSSATFGNGNANGDVKMDEAQDVGRADIDYDVADDDDRWLVE